MKRIYLSGPMTGIAEHNFPAFNAEAARLGALGYDVVNPVDINPIEAQSSWHECLRNDLAALLTCDTLALLDGWQGSAGAHLEMHVAHRVGMEIVVAREIGTTPVNAAAIADEAMLGLLESHTRRGDEFGILRLLVDEDGGEVDLLDLADPAIQDAVAWLKPRGLVDVVTEPDGREVVVMVEVIVA